MLKEKFMQGNSSPSATRYEIEKKPGEIVTGKSFVYNGETLVAEEGAERFNRCDDSDYQTIATGMYSHAEGSDAIATGYCSHAEGSSTRAHGNFSHAEGASTQASGNYSHAEGYSTIASGIQAHTEGHGTQAIGNYCHAEGYQTVAGKDDGLGGAHAEGNETQATGDYSHAEGDTTTASGTNSHAEGNSTTASGLYSHAEGNKTQATGDYSHAEGNSTTASGVYSHTEGIRSKASSNSAHAEGMDTIASGEESHAEGYETQATGKGSHAEGNTTIAKMSGAHAEGNTTTADGPGTHAEGASTTANGWWAHAEGAHTHAFGQTSHAEGQSTSALGEASHAEGTHTTTDYVVGMHVSGRYNKSITTSSGNALVIGNGSQASSDVEPSLSNCFRVTFAGAVYGLSAFNSSGADYAEYFEWLDGNVTDEDRVGYFVTILGNKIVKAKSTDYILGVVSGLPCIIGNADEDWLGRYQHDDFGRYLVEDAYKPKLDENGNETSEFIKIGIKYKENPNYDPSQQYIERKDRKEWSAVGMLGVLAVRDDGTCVVNGYAQVTDSGTATKAEVPAANTYRIIKRVSDRVIQIIFR